MEYNEIRSILIKTIQNNGNPLWFQSKCKSPFGSRQMGKEIILNFTTFGPYYKKKKNGVFYCSYYKKKETHFKVH